MFTDDMNALKRKIEFKDECITKLNDSLAKHKNKTENVKITVDALAYASEGINKIWEAHVINKAKSGLGYKYVPPPYRGVPSPPGIDLAHTGFAEFQEPIMEYGSKSTESPKVEKVSESLSKTSHSEDKVSSDTKADAIVVEKCTTDSDDDQVMSKP